MFNRILIIVVLLVGTLGYALYSKKSFESGLVQDEAQSLILKKLPQTQFTTLENEVVDLYQYMDESKAELLVVHFWGTWCGPCEAEMPELLQLINRFQNRPEVHFMLVAVNDEAFKVKKHLKTLGLPKNVSLTWLMDNQNVHRDIFGTTRVPETFLFSSDKTTLRKFLGPQEWNKTMFFQMLDEYSQSNTHKM